VKKTAPKKKSARKAVRPAGRKAEAGTTARRAAARQARRPVVTSPAASSPEGSPPIRLARVAKGKKPQYFSDPATDKLLWMTLTLMEELSVTRDRLDAVENLLEQRRVLQVADVDGYRPAGAAARRRQIQRAAYVDRMMRAAQAELEELTGRDMPRSEAEVVAAVEA
jgi:hypothetical protein